MKVILTGIRHRPDIIGTSYMLDLDEKTIREIVAQNPELTKEIHNKAIDSAIQAIPRENALPDDDWIEEHYTGFNQCRKQVINNIQKLRNEKRTN